MSEESKYYTPSIEEFHESFEYQWWGDEYGVGRWSDSKVPEKFDWFVGNRSLWLMIKYGRIRIKRLDKQDIIDCGWPFHGSNNEYYRFELKRGGAGNSSGELTDTVLTYVLEHYGNHVDIFTITGEGAERQYLFRGEPQNKYELKTLMRQLGIK